MSTHYRPARAASPAGRAPRTLRVLIAAAMVLGFGFAALPVAPGAAAQAIVTTEAELRAAFAAPAETEIVLGADIDLTCNGEPASFRRTSANDLAVRGDEHTITQTCPHTQIMAVRGTGELTIAATTLSGGEDSIDANGSHGGAISADDDVTIIDSALVGNRALGGVGGAVSSLGNVSVIGSTFRDNVAESGGAIFSSNSITVTRSTFTDNVARSRGGGGIFSSAARLIHATLVGNEARQGANIAVWEAPLAAFGSVIAMPAGGGQNCQLDVDGDAAGTGHNFADDASCNFTDATDTPSGGDPQLEALADNGGPTQTRLPAATSPLVDAIPEQDCDPASGTDQRGVERPQGSGCDIGAVEVEAVNAPPVAQDVSVLASQARPATVQLIATDPDGDDLSYTVAEQPEHGTLDGDGPRFSYTSEAGFSGTDTFTVKVCDPDDACDTAIVTVEVAAFQPPAEPPTDAGQLTVNPATAKAGDVVTVSGTGFEPGEAVFLVLYSEATSYGAVHVSADGKFSATITLRDNTEAGNHTLAAYGRKQSLAGALTITGNPGNGGVDDPGGDGNGGHGSGGSRVDNTPGTSGFSGSDDRKKGLALTGATVLPLVGGGLALLLAGTVGLLAARRTRHARTIEIGAP